MIHRSADFPGVRCANTAITCVTALTLALLAGCAAREPKEPVLSTAQRGANVESFDHVWITIRDKHFDETLNGVDWQAARDEFRPKVEAAETMSHARAAMNGMIARLGQSHFGIIPASAYKEMEAWTSGGGTGVTGIETCIVDGDALVWRVRPGSPAARAGVRPGWIIESVGDKKVHDVIARVSDAMGDSTHRELVLTRAVNEGMKGEIGTTVAVTFRDGDEKRATLEIERETPEGTLAKLGNLPGTHVRFNSRMLDGNIGYMTFNIWLNPAGLMPEIQQAISEFINADGIIFDFRGNPGGIGGMAMGLAGMFVDESGRHLGTMSSRQTDLNFIVTPRLEVYSGPLALLIDGGSASTTEIFVGGMKDLDRARLFGTRTAGAALPSIIERLPNGDGFQYAFANYVSAGGQTLEGEGVAPHVEVTLSREALLSGHDSVIDAAVEWIREQNEGGEAADEAADRRVDKETTIERVTHAERR